MSAARLARTLLASCDLCGVDVHRMATSPTTAHSMNTCPHEQDLDEHVDKLFMEAEELKAQIDMRESDVGDPAAVEAKTRADFKKMRSNIKQIIR
jgi:hypothetical protein